MKKIHEFEVKLVTKEQFKKLSEEILNNKDYFKEYDINTLSKKNNNLLHLALNYKNTELISVLLDNGIDLFKQNNNSMYPVFYVHNMKDFNLIINHPTIKNKPETIKRLNDLLYGDIVSPLYYWKAKQFNEFLIQNKETLNSINDDSITFLLNINQLLSVQLHEVWEKFKEDNDILFNNKEVYIYIINKVKDNTNNHYRTYDLNDNERQKIEYFKIHKEQLLNIIYEAMEDPEKIKKIPKLKLDPYNDFYLLNTPEYEQSNFLYKEIKNLKGSIKKGKITYIENNFFLDDLLYQWKDYLTPNNMKENELKIICQENGLVGINLSKVFSLSFIRKILNELKEETLKVFPIEDKKLFADNAYLKISHIFGQSSGYLHYAKDKNILNINIEDYSHNRENIFEEELKDIKSCFVHEYTHFLQTVSEYHYSMDFTKNKQWLKVENLILKTNNNSNNLSHKLKIIIREEFERNYFEFNDNEKLDIYLQEAVSMNNIEEAKEISTKIIQLCPQVQKSLKHKKYILDNIEFIYQCMHNQESNLQHLYLYKLNKDECLENYYNDPVELHARLNEHLLKIKRKDLIRDFNFLSEEDNQMKKKVVLKDLRKFNLLMLNHFNCLKEEKKKLIKHSE